MDDKYRVFVVDDQRFYIFNQVEPQTVFHNLIFSLVKSAIALNEISFHKCVFVGDNIHHR